MDTFKGIQHNTGNFDLLLWQLADKPHETLLYAEYIYIYYIYLYLKILSNHRKHLP